MHHNNALKTPTWSLYAKLKASETHTQINLKNSFAVRFVGVRLTLLMRSSLHCSVFFYFPVFSCVVP